MALELVISKIILTEMLLILIMEKYEQLLNMLMDFNESVRFAAVSDGSGNLLWNSQRDGVSNIVPIEKTKATMSRSRGEWDDYASSAEYYR